MSINPKKFLRTFLFGLGRSPFPADKVKVIPRSRVTDFEDFTYMGSFQEWPVDPRVMRRMYERNPWVHAAVNRIANAITSLQFKIVPREEFIPLVSSKMLIAATRVKSIFSAKNNRFMTFNKLIEAVVIDLLVYGQAAIEKVRVPDGEHKGRMVGLLPVDGSTISIDLDEHGIVRGYIHMPRRYSTLGGFPETSVLFNKYISMGKHVYFDKDDLVFLRLRERAGTSYGFSPIAVLIQAIQSDLYADAHIAKFLASGGTPKGILSIEGLDPDNVKRIRQEMQQQQRRGHHISIVSGGEHIRWYPLVMNNRDAEMASIQHYLRNKILSVFSVPPNHIGQIEGFNRAVAFNQDDIFWANAVLPLAYKIADAITDEIISEFDDRLKLAVFPPEEHQKEAKLARVTAELESGYINYEEARRQLGIPTPKTKPLVEESKELLVKANKLQNRQLELQIEMLEKQLAAADMQLQRAQQRQVQRGGEQRNQQTEQQANEEVTNEEESNEGIADAVAKSVQASLIPRDYLDFNMIDNILFNKKNQGKRIKRKQSITDTKSNYDTSAGVTSRRNTPLNVFGKKGKMILSGIDEKRFKNTFDIKKFYENDEINRQKRDKNKKSIAELFEKYFVLND